MTCNGECTIEAKATDSKEVTSRMLLKFYISKLSPECLEVLTIQAQALMQGHEEYGSLDLDDTKKDYLSEAIEEARDMTNYLTFKLIQLQRRKDAR